ncbi:MAG: Ldh family oxidoreductase [Bacillati bacterium ANGP1]|uniref:Ldh family oxidoreductase n=1 Tax=Candidatus Segetimicrobium genomatis TaxID=2569760 RepID=A0A537J8W8_9BACT|nr:MAG: Ldh family oxidoreductase [Terrabacteria group bacterium ANGP1]
MRGEEGVGSSMETVRFPAEVLLGTGARIFQAAGAPAETARVVASALVEANLKGHDSHGVLRIPQYLDRIRKGQIKPAAQPRIQGERGATALVSGEWGFGQLAGIAATDEAVRRAQEYGVSAVGVVRCNHLGRVGAYVEQAAAKDCAAMVWVGGLGTRPAVPHGGSRSALGTNPISAGFPVQGEHPVVLDYATTAIAVGKIMVARDAGKPLPPGVMIDKNGRPSTDPEVFYKEGALLPFGGHKGYSLSVIAELLGQALTGADRYQDAGTAEEVFRHAGALIVAIHAGAFRPAEEAKAVARRLVTRLRMVPPAQGVESVLTPGEPEARTMRQRTASGIELAGETWRSILAAAESVGVPPRDLPSPGDLPAE